MKFFLIFTIALMSLLPAAHVDLYVLTGQSNSLGTTAGGEADVSPGIDPADAQVKFFWSNRATSSVVIGGPLVPVDRGAQLMANLRAVVAGVRA